MKVFPVCSESLGVRSLAVFVETTDVKIFIDPGAALGMRYGLEPSDEEWNMLSHFKERIREIANICDIITISHYHYDHYDPDENFYEGKKVFAKDIKSNINKSQQVRGTEFKKIFEDKFKNMGELIYCDNQNYEFGNTLIKFSSPFPHGEPGTKLGFVLMTTIEEKSEGGNFKILHTSDAGGAVDEESRDYIISGQPNLIIMDGIASYLAGYRIKRENLEISGKTSNWDRVSLPEICCQPGFSGLFKLSDLPSVGKLQENSKNFTVVLNPLSSAVAQIPAIQFSYFDPEKERYQVIDTKALPVSVSSQDMIELRSVAPLPVKTTSGPVDWIKIYQSLSPLEPQKMFVLTTRDLNNLFLGSWKILGLIPLLAILTLAQMVLKKVLKQSEKKDRQTSQDLYTELQKMSFDSLGFFELYKKIFMVRLKEKGLIVDRDMSYEDLPLTGIEGEVRSILKEIDALRYSGSYLETGDLKKAYEKGLVLYKKL